MLLIRGLIVLTICVKDRQVTDLDVLDLFFLEAVDSVRFQLVFTTFLFCFIISFLFMLLPINHPLWFFYYFFCFFILSFALLFFVVRDHVSDSCKGTVGRFSHFCRNDGPLRRI